MKIGHTLDIEEGVSWYQPNKKEMRKGTCKISIITKVCKRYEAYLCIKQYMGPYQRFGTYNTYLEASQAIYDWQKDFYNNSVKS